MVEIKKQVIKKIDTNFIVKDKPIFLYDLIIENLDFGFLEFNCSVVIENCIIDMLTIHSCWFHEGLILRNNIIKKNIDYQMGGHNNKPIIISNNIFCGFFNFFDCHFNDVVEVSNNIFFDGTNLLGNLDSGFGNLFEKGNSIKGNIGDLAMNEIL